MAEIPTSYLAVSVRAAHRKKPSVDLKIGVDSLCVSRDTYIWSMLNRTEIIYYG